MAPYDGVERRLQVGFQLCNNAAGSAGPARGVVWLVEQARWLKGLEKCCEGACVVH